MPYDQLEIHSINRTSGVYMLRLNFDGNVNFISTGSKTRIPAQGCLMTLGTFNSSKLTEELANSLGNLSVELSDHPGLVWQDGTGNIIRECFEYARANNFLVHAILARFSNDETPVFQEFVFSGSYDPREMTVAHRRRPKVGRRTETLSVEFTPAKRLDVPLSEIVWAEADMEAQRPSWLCVVCEPGQTSALSQYRFMPKKITRLVIEGKVDLNFPPWNANDVYIDDPKRLTHDLAYGSNPYSTNVDVDALRDETGTGPFPIGNWVIKLTTAIDRVFTACDIVWDGVVPSGLNFHIAHYEEAAEIFEDDGEVGFDQVALSWNYLFGINPYDGTSFKGPVTYDGDMYCREFLKSIAAQLKCRIDIYDYTATGLPIARLIPFGATSGTFPVLEELPESSEDAFVTDKDGVRVTRRGFEGAIIAPADAKSPVDIEIPFAPYAIGYESAPCFDASRLTPNASLEFKDQWKFGFRGALSQDGGAAEDNYPLNPDGWGIASHLLYFENNQNIYHFPASHNYTPGDFDGGTQVVYQSERWRGWYPLHAIYDVARGDLSEDQRKDRQKNFLISYALYFGRYLRGERRRLVIQFRGCVAPNWSDIQTGMTYTFQPIDTDVEYASVEIEKDIGSDITTVHFEETTISTLEISYREDGEQKGSGSVGGQGSSANDSGGIGDTSLIKAPFSATRNDTQSTDDTYSAIRVKQHSATQSADLLPVYNADLTTLLSGIDNAGTVFSKIQAGFRLSPYGASAGNTGEQRFYALNNTNYVGFKSKDTIAANKIWTLPNTDGAAGQTIGTDGAGNLGWYSAGLSFWTESQNTAAPNNVIYANRLIAIGSATNIDAIISPKGTGAKLSHLPDSTSAGGNKRGSYAVDWSTIRGSAAAVASGDYSSIGGGRDNAATTDYATVAGGGFNTASGGGAFVGGGSSNTALGQNSMIGGGDGNHANGAFSTIPGGKSLTLSNQGNFGFNSGSAGSGRAMTIATDDTATLANVDLWLANNDNAARALKFWAPWNTAGAFPSTNKFAAIKAGVVTTSYTWILPLADSAGFLKSDGSGNLSLDATGTSLTDVVIKTPTTLNRNRIAKPNSATVAGLEITAIAGGISNLFECYDNGGTLQLAIDFTGSITSHVLGVFSGGIDFTTNTDTQMTGGTQSSGSNTADIWAWRNNGNTKHTTLNASHKLGINLAGSNVTRTLEVNGDSGIATSLLVGALTAPATTLDVNGNFATRRSTFAAVNGNNNNCAFPSNTFVEITAPNAAYTITGITGGQNGSWLVIRNRTGVALTISNKNAGSAAANQIDTLTGGNLVTVGDGAFLLVYNATVNFWQVISWQA